MFLTAADILLRLVGRSKTLTEKKADVIKVAQWFIDKGYEKKKVVSPLSFFSFHPSLIFPSPKQDFELLQEEVWQEAERLLREGAPELQAQFDFLDAAFLVRRLKEWADCKFQSNKRKSNFFFFFFLLGLIFFFFFFLTQRKDPRLIPFLIL
jgi:hypothetical protein